MATLRNHFAARWDLDQAFEFSGLGNPFPRGITFGDIDAETEIGGRFLIIEGKREHEELSAGQAHTMDARAADGRTCLVIYGDPPGGVRAMRVWGHERVAASIADVHLFVHAWAQWAERQPRPAPRAPMSIVPRPIAQAVSRCGVRSPGGTERCGKPVGHNLAHISPTEVWPPTMSETA